MKYRKQVEVDIMCQYIDINKKTLEIGGMGTYNYLFKNIHICNIRPLKLDNFKQCDINKGLPYQNNEFDTVLLTHVLEHIENFWYIIRECKRVMKQDGKLFISIPNIINLRSKLHFLLTGKIRIISPDFDRGDKTVVMPYIVKRYSEHLGFDIIYEGYCGGIIPIIRIKIKESKAWGLSYTIILLKVKR